MARLAGLAGRATAALFNPVRRRVQRSVDRQFNGARYDADQMVTAHVSLWTNDRL